MKLQMSLRYFLINIREIILGHNVSPEVEEYARTQLDTSIEVYKMSTPDDGYLLVKEKLK